MTKKATKQTKGSSQKTLLKPTKRFKLRIALHRHSGRRLPWQHTSYAGLFFLLTLTGASLLLAGRAATASQGTIDLNGTVNGPPPTVAAQILHPADGAHVTSSILNVNGTCEEGLLIQVFRNDAFAGSAICSNDATFSLNVTVFSGANQLYAKSSDSLDRYAPNSNAITVYYDRAPSPGASSVGSLPLSILTTPIQQGVSAGQGMTLKYQIAGGALPYALSISWGDSTPDDLTVLNNTGDFSSTHTYKAAGQYSITLNATDKNGQKASIQTIALVNGEPAAGAVTASSPGCNTNQPSCTQSSSLVRLVNRVWPAFVIACLMTFSFWIGERVIIRQNRRPPQTFVRS